MIVCPHCSFENPEGTLVCGQCHQSVLDTVDVDNWRRTQQIVAPSNLLHAGPGEGGQSLASTAAIFLRVQGESQPFRFEPGEELLLGRRDPANQVNPDLDLTPYQAHEKGVSRVHAAIRRQDDVLMLVDLGSSNGTRINGKRLVPNQPDVLHDGDEIRLGNLVIHIFME